MVMGCYGHWHQPDLQALIEQSSTYYGIVWPCPPAPFHVLTVCLKDPQLPERWTWRKTRQPPRKGRFRTCWFDDSCPNAGVKIHRTAELIGIPLRSLSGGNGLKEGIIELQGRAQKVDVVSPAPRGGSLRQSAARGGGVGPFHYSWRQNKPELLPAPRGKAETDLEVSLACPWC